MTKIHVAIPTFMRHNMLYLLLEDIYSSSRNLDIVIYIYDDDDRQIEPHWLESISEDSVIWKFNDEHRGKKGFWKTVDELITDSRMSDWDYFFMFPDDVRLEPFYFYNMIDMWGCITDERKACLNPLVDHSRKSARNWTHIDPKIEFVKNGRPIYRVGWVDCIFMCERQMFDALDWQIYPVPESRWNSNPNLSSGVGQQMSERLIGKNLSMYQVYESLAHHGDHPSMMNPTERKHNPLIG